MVVHEGRTNFSELQAELAAGRQGRLVYYAFDLLWRNGDLRKLPQIERKQLLLGLLGENDIELPVLYSEHLIGDGQEMFEHAAKLNWEGIISKRADCALPIGANRSLAENQNRAEGKFPVIGFVKDPTGVAALYLGKREGKDWSIWARSARVVSHGLQPNPQAARYRVSPKSKLTKPIKKPKATWVEPKFFADVEYRDITSEGLLGQLVQRTLSG